MPGLPSSGIPCTLHSHEASGAQTQGMKGFQPLGFCPAVVPMNILQSFQSRALPTGAWGAGGGAELLPPPLPHPQLSLVLQL